MDKGNFRRRDRLVKEKQHDTYRERKKRTEPTACTECGAVFMGGRWTWAEPPEAVVRDRCPACLRIGDNFPAGYVEFRGDFFEQRGRKYLTWLIMRKSWKKVNTQWKGLWQLRRKLIIL